MAEPQAQRLRGRRFLVTGGSGGIGRAVAERLTSELGEVVILDRRLVEDTARSFWSLECDVSMEDSVAHALAELGQRWQVMHGVVHCAGISARGSVATTTRAAWDRLIEVNLTGFFLVMKHALPLLIPARGSSAVAVASLQGLYGWPNYAAYAASKAGLIGVTRQMAIDLEPHHVRANIVAPGNIATDLGGNSQVLEGDWVRAIEPPLPSGLRFRTPGQPSDVAGAVAFLVSDDAAFVNGHVLVVDGGASVRLQDYEVHTP